MQELEQCSKSDEKPTLSDADVWRTLASRRQSFDAMVWQAAGFALTAQSFLYTIALNGNNVSLARIIALSLSIACALATIHVMSKHRLHELSDSEYLGDMEKKNGWRQIHGESDDPKKRVRRSCWLKFGSVNVWLSLLWFFIIISSGLLIYIFCDNAALQSNGTSTAIALPAIQSTNPVTPPLINQFSNAPSQ